ncbi:hypothetical protein Ndes2526B_g03943 [Nannochloris sp. 'desiccata']|nr:hypothetical protein KSW81_006086 [Chlorella desiccata (nom. nud.)]KAH7621099.1 hypothetical protein NADE_009150 [Chlorella desiccata (nom. nud.)]
MSTRVFRSAGRGTGQTGDLVGRGGGRVGQTSAQGRGGQPRENPGQSQPENRQSQGQRLVDISKVDFLKLAKDFPTFSGDNGVQPEDYLIQFSKMAKFTGFTSQQLMEIIPVT